MDERMEGALYPGALRAEQRRRCRAGQHRWTAWGNFMPVAPKFPAAGYMPAKPSPEFEPVEAYRWRECECGVRERETYQGDRELFGPEPSASPDTAAP